MENSEHTMKRELDDAEALMQPVLVPVKSGTERTSEDSAMEENLETMENRGNVENSVCTLKRELDDAEELMQPVFVCVESVIEGTPEDSIMEENLQTMDNTGNIESSVCALKRERVDAGALTSSLFLCTEPEPDFQGTLEDRIMKDKLEATQNTETRDVVTYDFKMKKNITDVGASMASSFVRTKTESDLEKTSDESVVEEHSQASKMTEVLVSQANFLVKEEPIDCEETWQDSIKLQPTCPLSINTQSGGSDESSDGGVNVKIEDIVKEEVLSEELTRPCSIKEEKHDISVGNNWHPCLDSSPLPCNSQFLSSTQSLSEMEVIETQKNCGRCYLCYASKSDVLPIAGCQTVLPVASYSKNDNTVGQEKEAVTYLCKTHVEQQVAGDRISTNLEESHSKGEMLQMGSLGRSTDERKFKCGHCGKDFKKKSDLVRHVRIHTGDRPYKCSQCGKSFIECGHLSRHMRKHTYDRPYKCSQCGKSFSESGSLTKHMRTHTGDRPYKCSQCGKSFTLNSSLTKHLRTHSGDRPYKCSQCGKSFRESSSLTGHMRTHTGDRPYKCTHCGKCFTFSSQFTNHKRTHSGDRPYKCSQCGKSFTESSSLAKHMRTH